MVCRIQFILLGVAQILQVSSDNATNLLNLDATNSQVAHVNELQDRLHVSEMLLKKLYVQNQELTEKLSKAQNKISEMDKDYRVLQKQHLLLQHNIQNKLIGKLFICIDLSYYRHY